MMMKQTTEKQSAFPKKKKEKRGGTFDRPTLFFWSSFWNKRSPHFFPRERERERRFARFLFLVMATTEFDRESTATSRRVEKRDFSNSFDDAERYRGDRVSNDAFVKKLIEQRKEREEKWFAFEQQKWFDTQRNIQADRELEKLKREVEEKKREVEELKFEAMTRMMTAQLQSRNYNRLGQISPYYGNS
tara:strand:+ start:2121 stop:2687 length:567 start_codon:yes stop_codon:yes gene_type:complete